MWPDSVQAVGVLKGGVGHCRALLAVRFHTALQICLGSLRLLRDGRGGRHWQNLTAGAAH